jgi:hypothetical protein
VGFFLELKEEVLGQQLRNYQHRSFIVLASFVVEFVAFPSLVGLVFVAYLPFAFDLALVVVVAFLALVVVVAFLGSFGFGILLVRLICNLFVVSCFCYHIVVVCCRFVASIEEVVG